MKKLMATLFAIVACLTTLAPAAFANNGRADNGSPGNYDNYTGCDQGNGQQFQHGQGWHAAYYC